MNLKKTKIFFLIPIFLLVVFYPASQSKADIAFDQNGKWETTFDCPEWEQFNTLNCDGIARGGNWYPNGDTTYRSRIIYEANNPAGRGGKGARFWKGSGHDNNCSGTLVVAFPSPQQEIWVRWYHRYEAGFEWKLGIGAGTKELYFYAGGGNPGSTYIGYGWGGAYRIYNQGGNPATSLLATTTWNTDYPGGISDGSWTSYELYMRMDSEKEPGTVRVWRNGILVAENTSINWSSEDAIARQGWTRFQFISNQKDPGLDRPYYADLDDMVIYNQTPPNLDSQGNPFIGPIDWGEEVPPLPGDLNSDGTVNIFDYNIFLQNFGATDCDNIADLNNDCNVNIFDYNILLQNFGRSA